MNRPIAAAIGALAFFASAFATRSLTSLWYDELFTVWVAAHPWAEIATQANADGFTPPLYYFLVKGLLWVGAQLEDLRVLPILFGAMALVAAWDAASRLFGSSARIVSLLVVGCSSYLFTFAHELRPYSLLIALTFFVLGRLGGERSAASDALAGWTTLAATAFSYLGATLVAIWCWETRGRVSRRRFWSMVLLAMLAGLPGLMKAAHLAAAWPGSSIDQSQAPLSISASLFGAGVLPFGARVEQPLWAVVALAAMFAVRKARATPAISFLVRACVFSLAAVFLLNTAVRTGFAPRYFAVAWSVAALLGVGLQSEAGRKGVVFGVLVAITNMWAIAGYLAASPPAREDWRGVMKRFEKLLGSRGVLLSFPYHHGAVAAYSYASGLQVGGGFTSRQPPVFWYDPPARFAGYGFAGLQRFDTAGEALSRVALGTSTCLVSDQADVTKTAGVFTAFERLGAKPFDTGDPRIRALCRVPD